MAAAVRVRTMRFDERPSVGDADDAPLATLAPPMRKQLGPRDRMTNPSGPGGGESGRDYNGDHASEVWFKDNRLGHRHQAAYLRRLERLRHDLHDAERGHVRDSLDRLLGLSHGGAAGKLPEAPVSHPIAAAAAVGWPLADRRAPWLARSPEERALLESALDGARRAHSRPRRSAEPPAPAVRRLLAADAPASIGAARRSTASGHESGLATAAIVSSCSYSRGGSGGAEAVTSPSLALGRHDDPAAVGASLSGFKASLPCAPTIPTLNRMPSKFSVAASDSGGGSHKKDASARCSRTAPAAAAAPVGSRGRLAKGGSLARAVTAMRASAATAGCGGGGESLLDPSALVVPGKRLAVAPAYDYDAAAAAATDSTPLTPAGDEGDTEEVLPELAAAALIEPGLRVVMPDPGARALSRSTDVKCESAMQPRTRSVTFVSTYAA